MSETTPNLTVYTALLIEQELEAAKRHGKKFASLHEAYAVILEELDEIWEIVRQKKRDRDPDKLHDEFVQLAAMAVKALQTVNDFVGGDL